MIFDLCIFFRNAKMILRRLEDVTLVPQALAGTFEAIEHIEQKVVQSGHDICLRVLLPSLALIRLRP